MPDAEGTLVVPADPARLYELVSDVTNMGRWSPETTTCRWITPATGATVGARFRGSNRAGWRRWQTICTVTAAEPDKRFAFSVEWFGFPISQWTYDFEPQDGGCRVTESWEDRRPSWMRVMSPTVMGVPDRALHNQAGIQATLAALQSAVLD